MRSRVGRSGQRPAQLDDTDAAYVELEQRFNKQGIAELRDALAVIKGWNLSKLSRRDQIREVPSPVF